jgi:hypothetical protein
LLAFLQAQLLVVVSRHKKVNGQLECIYAFHYIVVSRHFDQGERTADKELLCGHEHFWNRSTTWSDKELLCGHEHFLNQSTIWSDKELLCGHKHFWNQSTVLSDKELLCGHEHFWNQSTV